MAEREDTLRVYRDGKVIFRSNGAWLHPLFELEDFLLSGDHDRSSLHLEDTVVGKAAAFLIWRLGIPSVKTGILSRLGAEVLETAGIAFKCDELVDRILCQTEQILAAVDDAEQAYEILKARAAGADSA